MNQQLKTTFGDAAMAVGALQHAFSGSEERQWVDLCAEEQSGCPTADFDALMAELPHLWCHLTPGARQALCALLERIECAVSLVDDTLDD